MFEQSAMPTVEERLETLENRAAQLESSLITANETVTRLQGIIVEITADHVNRLFSDQVMLDSIAQRVLVAGANAIAYKAKMSRQKAPELVVLEGYLPGAVRATLTEDGARIEMESKDHPGSWISGDGLPEQFQNPSLQQAFGELLISYGAELEKTYFVMEAGDVEEARQKAQNLAMSLTNMAAPKPAQYGLVTRVHSLTGTYEGDDYPEAALLSDADFHVIRDGVEVPGVVPVGDLVPGDVIKMMRDGAMCLESVVSVTPLN
ncbi:hypothetical protein D3C85_14370 [compost metagenome]